MIDLTKPIRRKDGKESKWTRVHGFEYRLKSDSGDGCTIDPAILERDYENIPEPRKPREWMSAVSAIDCDVVNAYRVTADRRHEQFLRYIEGPRFRLIEWPEGAELPEWPE